MVATTRKFIVTLGLLLVLGGLFVVSQGVQVLIPGAEIFGLVSHPQIETTMMPPTVLPVAATNYSFLAADLKGGVHVKGSLEVADGREISFYVMNQGNFSEWRKGRPSTIILAKPFAVSYNFTFTPTTDGTYFFVFDNQDTSRRAVIFGLNVVESVAVLNPVIEYAGYLILAVGIILSALGIKTGRKKAEAKMPSAPSVAGWRCKFCGAENVGEQVFCEKCGRSQG